MRPSSPPPASSRKNSKTAAFGCAVGSRSVTARVSSSPARSKSRSPSATDRNSKNAIVDAAVRQPSVLGTRRLAPAGAAALALLLAGCSSALLSIGAPPGSLPEAPRQAQQQPQPPAPTSREHQRILAAYNGAYDDPKLEGLVNQTAAKLVAASERPDVHYRVTILNSDAVNAFALPTGQLYVTRGLIALANDTSEIASVLSHEMSHVIARHAAMREDQERQVALVSRVVQDVLSDPETGALALAKSKIALASFSRAQEFEADGSGIGIAARRLRSLRRGAFPHFDGTQRRAEIQFKPIAHRPARARFPLLPSGDTRAHQERAGKRPPGQRARRRRTRQGRLSRQRRRHGLRRGPERRLRAWPPLPASKARLHFSGAGGIRARQHRAGGSRRQGERRPSFAARCRARARGTDARGLPQVRLGREHRPQIRRGGRHQRAAGGDRDRQRRPVGVSALCGAVRQRRLSLHLRLQAHDRGGRPRLSRIRRQLPSHDAGGKPGGKAPAYQDRDRRTR